MIDRRTALAAPLMLAGAPALAQTHGQPLMRTAPPLRRLSASDELAWLDATETAARIRRGELSAREVVEAAIVRAEALNPRLNFLVTPDFDRARARAMERPAGPFGGVPFLVKDLDNYKGLPTRHGSRAYADAPPAEQQSPLIDADVAAGFVVLGKSATPEQGYLPTTEPLGQPPTRNPWDLNRSSGGSSGGAAAAVASGVVPIAHASDGGGSIRIPASCCGLFGLKPSRGRLLPASRGGAAPPVDIGVEHCLARSVRDSAALFAWTERKGAGAAYPPVGLVTGPSKRRLRVGLVIAGASGVAPDPEVAAATRDTAKLLESLGHQVEPTAWPIDTATFFRDFLIYWASGARMDVEAVAKKLGRAPTEGEVEPFSLGMAKMVANTPGREIGAAIARLKAVAPAYDGWFNRFDVILSPVLRTPPPPLGYVRGDVPFDELSARLTAYVGYTPIHNVAGAPAMSVPLHWTATGLPVGSQLAARAGGERTLYELAYELEAARPWTSRRPPAGS